MTVSLAIQVSQSSWLGLASQPPSHKYEQPSVRPSTAVMKLEFSFFPLSLGPKQQQQQLLLTHVRLLKKNNISKKPAVSQSV